MTSEDRSQIEATVNKYLSGIAETKPELVAEAFHPDAVMTSNSGGSYRSVNNVGQHLLKFMAGIPPTHEHSPDYRGSIHAIMQDGTMAFVAVAEDQLQGKDMKTYFLLHKIDGDWLIASKATWAPN